MRSLRSRIVRGRSCGTRGCAISDTGRGVDGASRIRAIWSPDYRPKEKTKELIDLLSAPGGAPGDAKPNPDLIRMTLDPLDRSMLVTLMAGFDATVEGGGAYQPLSSEAKRLHLTSLGALIDAEGTWSTTPDHVDLEQWRHLATLGRDHYVRVIYAGYLWPFGHAASLVKVTERKFESLGPSNHTTRRTAAPALLHRRARAGANVYRRTPHVRGPELSVYAHRAADARHARPERTGQRRQRQRRFQRCTCRRPGVAHAVLADGASGRRRSSPMCPSRFARPISRASRRRSRCRCSSSARSPSTTRRRKSRMRTTQRYRRSAAPRPAARSSPTRRPIRRTRATRACRRRG